MAEKKPTKRSLTFIFEKAPDFRLMRADGIWGGITPRGDLEINFFLDTNSLPAEATYELTPKNTLGKEQSRKLAYEKGKVLRLVNCGIVVSPNVAKSIVDWLNEKLDALAKLEEKEAKSNESSTGKLRH
jgi:hypothetical protein